jgi:biopolymer transport protein ExbD
MKQSPRAKRLAKHHKRFKSESKLNLVALMDIFTILVFFLIVNQSEVRVLQNIESIELPVSIAEELPVDNLVITLLGDTVLVQERAIWQKNSNSDEQELLDTSTLDTPTIDTNTDVTPAFVDALKTELLYQANKRPELTESEQEKGRAVTIIGDASTPYSMLKQVMAACADTGYRNMSLAVEQRAKEKQGES